MHDTYFEEAVYRLGIKHQALISSCLDFGFIKEAKGLQELGTSIRYLLKTQRRAFDFVEYITQSKVLLVGEGNLSFAYSLSQKRRINPRNLTATTYENVAELSEESKVNASKLRSIGVKVAHAVDATQLSNQFGAEKFDHIIFQFPHSGSREPVNGENSNAVLVHKFLKSAATRLRPSGSVLISTVDSPHYHGAFQFDNAAEKSGFYEPVAYRFDPTQFPHYTHTMTHSDDSALDYHNAFATWIFTPK